MNVKYPFQLDNSGRTATSSYEEHIREMVEQVLFTSPGERVNRPTFGSGLLQLVFEPNSIELESTTQYLIQSALQQWLGELIEIQNVELDSLDSTISIRIDYVILKTGKKDAVQISKEIR